MALSPSVKDRELNRFDKSNNVKVALNNGAGEINVQNPMPADGDSIYSKDINEDESNLYNFDGDATDFFDDLTSISSDTTSNNPKQLMFWFERTIYSSAIGLGCNDLAGNFSNVRLSLLGSGQVVRKTVDLSADDTKYNSLLVEFEPAAFNGFLLEFVTVDPVCLSNITARKSNQVDARIQGQSPDGTVVDFQATPKGNFKVSVEEYGDTPSIDAFARLRVSEPFTIFDSKQLHDKQPLFWDEIIGGGGTSTHVPADADVEMSVTTTGDYVMRQTRQRFNYQPGKSQLIYMTFYAPPGGDAIRRVGAFDGTGAEYLDPNNGIFFEFNGIPSWNICKNGTIEQTIEQENWNYDKLDGTGPSGKTLDLNGPQILIIDYEWLGLGRVRVGFIIDGLIAYVHYFNHANNPLLSSVYMSTPNLALRYSIESNGGAGTLKHVCSTVMSEGGIEKTGVLRVGETPVVMNSLNTGVTYAAVGIRLKDAYKDVTIIPESFSMVALTADPFRWALHLNPTISNTFLYQDLSNSSVQVAVGTSDDNEITDEGLVLASGFASDRSREAGDTLNTALRIGSSIAGVQDELVLSVRPLSNNLQMYGALNFRELL